MDERPFYAPNSDEHILAILSHILAIVPGIGILGPLVIYLLKKDDSGFVAENAKESLNFQITILLAILLLALIGGFFIWILGILNVVLVIVATIKASENMIYRYPFNMRLIR